MRGGAELAGGPGAALRSTAAREEEAADGRRPGIKGHAQAERERER